MVVECMPGLCKALDSFSDTEKKKEKYRDDIQLIAPPVVGTGTPGVIFEVNKPGSSIKLSYRETWFEWELLPHLASFVFLFVMV